MKLYAIMIVKVDPGATGEPVVCCQATDVSDVGMFQRSAAREFLVFFSRTVAKRVTPLSRTQVTEQGRVLFAHSFAGGRLVATAIGDDEYNGRVAFSMLSTVEQQFQDTFRGRWEGVSKDDALSFPYLGETLAKYQKPEEADKILKIQRDIDDTKVVLHSAIDQVLERGEKIDNLVEISGDLSMASKGFYKSAKKTNSTCCVVC
uniref:V-SNARE coiled-coil homology domain-containing protein n=1 Tax=Neobodo designis TaxID=312471 RepID=A0A7S1PTQ2_NEODS|mmetsp:Transcript_17950/g.55769  ORF Transcript_17950/g.55769 Transcript_17950/m.55769 type:complete len:204 (+) Transcript_17950:112-723(+)|eukprot:CAMPEP_0174827464 /NCGR_PEP_ID=MMETSP1114-20130205/737_1 /TAXON_ID=312471 /ORGANISM="Neobodo designis, Strain CCAP 1951/1" /LENGTH=203 /DNA_ID=CAMNT_0016061121 /DNA_START=112 /DNA_END=723 /DNA_ORIENTATION=-